MEKFKTAAILAGGNSSRMGFDKQLITLNNKRLSEKVAEALGEIFSDIIVITESPELYRTEAVRTFSDEYRGKGPLAGIYMALKQAQSEYVYMHACDMPVVCPEYIRYMMDRTMESRADICVARRNEKIEPFGAFYSKALADEVERRLKADETSLFRFIKSADTLILPEEEISVYEDRFSVYTNLNTMTDYLEYVKEKDYEDNGHSSHCHVQSRKI